MCSGPKDQPPTSFFFLRQSKKAGFGLLSRVYNYTDRAELPKTSGLRPSLDVNLMRGSNIHGQLWARYTEKFIPFPFSFNTILGITKYRLESRRSLAKKIAYKIIGLKLPNVFYWWENRKIMSCQTVVAFDEKPLPKQYYYLQIRSRRTVIFSVKMANLKKCGFDISIQGARKEKNFSSFRVFIWDGGGDTFISSSIPGMTIQVLWRTKLYRDDGKSTRSHAHVNLQL